MPLPPTESPQQPAMSDLHATLGGAVAGALAPLSTKAAAAFNHQTDFNLSDIPWALMFAFSVIGAAVVYFIAERVKRHVFTYGVVAPFLVLGTVKTYQADQAEGQKKQAENAEIKSKEVAADLANDLQKARAIATRRSNDELGQEGVQALTTPDAPAL